VPNNLFSDLNATHDHEEELRAESIALINADPELSKRLATITKAMTLIFCYTLDHASGSDDEATMHMLGVRLFNAAASGVKLAFSGYYQTAFQQARDIMETGFLLDYFRTSPEKIALWKAADNATRRRLFSPVQIRKALDERDGDTKKERAEQYSILSEIASHATWRGFKLTSRQAFGQIGPFVEPINLKAWLHEMVLRLGPSSFMYANQFKDADSKLVRFTQEFGTELILGFKQNEESSEQPSGEAGRGD
jgi:hypothetical protein